MRLLPIPPASSSIKRRKPLTSQRGVSLVMVLIFLLLAIISVLGAFRAGFLNEKMVGNESDYNRAFAAAEALLRDAEIDIRGRRPPYDLTQADDNIGFPCRPPTDGNTVEITSKVGYGNSCRLRDGATPWIPKNSDDFDAVRNIVIAGGGTDRCLAGICFPLNMDDLAAVETKILNGTVAGVAYGAFTRTDTLANANLDPTQSNPILATKDAAGAATPPRAWYVIEAFKHEPVSCGNPLGCPATQMNQYGGPSGTDPAFVFRITAVVRGLKQGTVVVLKSTFVPRPAYQNP